MCGRFVRKHKSLQAATRFQAALIQELPPSYNIAPTHAAVRVKLGDSAPKIALTSDEIISENGLAFSRGKLTGQIAIGRAGARRELDEKYLMILKRQPDSTWRIARVMWSR